MIKLHEDPKTGVRQCKHDWKKRGAIEKDEKYQAEGFYFTDSSFGFGH